MAKRTDQAFRVVRAAPADVYRAFARREAMESWLPPRGMCARMSAFDFREGGFYRVHLTYDEESGRGKTSAHADDVEVRFVRLVENERIEQDVRFDSTDPSFAGIMRMIWTLEPVLDGTKVTIRAQDVPEGIGPEDHATGLESTLENLASFVEANNG